MNNEKASQQSSPVAEPRDQLNTLLSYVEERAQDVRSVVDALKRHAGSPRGRPLQRLDRLSQHVGRLSDASGFEGAEFEAQDALASQSRVHFRLKVVRTLRVRTGRSHEAVTKPPSCPHTEYADYNGP